MTITIKGTLTTLSELTIGAPGALKIDIATGKVSPKGMPVSPIAELTVPGPDREDGISGNITVPIIPANTLRGLLRRAGATHVELAMIRRGEQISLPAYNGLRSGSPFGNPDKADPGIDEVQKAMAVPPLGVFGGGPRMIPGRLRVDTGFPCTLDMLQRGIIEAGHDTVTADRLVGTRWRKRNDDAGNFLEPEVAEQVIREYLTAIDAWQAVIGGDQDDAEDEDAGDDEDAPKRKATPASAKLRGLNALTGMRCVNPGVPFAFRIELHTDMAASIGYLLLALETFANNQRLGGNWRIGCGRFALNATIDDGSGASRLFTGAAGALRLDTSNPLVADALKAARAWLDTVTAAELDALFAYSEKGKADHRAKIGRAGADALAAYNVLAGDA